ncbi:sulfatase [Thalassotalea euphylliae]|uniref:Sulfatase n=1 Tax=Thalassotalea euphylliae TaxID=1655234 RepID=A0A3E0UBS2_9GAMM|nr:sulfatase [Thalassotalea euphylliae]REL34339.1 sulfatase [Thalassotalea euphylliae]
MIKTHRVTHAKRFTVSRLGAVFASLAIGLLTSQAQALATTSDGQQSQPSSQLEKQASGQPNIVLFLVDDMGWQDTSLAFTAQPTPANQHFRTPNMEALAAKGVKFTQAYSHAVCSPSRVSLMTGQNPTRHHVSNWTKLPDIDHSGSWGPNAAPRDWRTEGLQPNDVTLAKTLQQAGYHTIHVGKAHFGAYGTRGAEPKNLGFDVNIAGHAAGAPASYWGEKNFGNGMDGAEGLPQGVPGLAEYHQQKVHLTDVLTEKAKQEISKAQQTGKPFFLNMAYYAVHTPIEAHQRLVKHYQNKTYEGTDIDIPVVEENYASLVEGMDDSVGGVLAHLEALGIAENTLVVFTSDNGGLSGHSRQTTPRGTELNSHNWPLHSGKGSAYEGGTRVPYIVAWAKPDQQAAMQQALPIAVNKMSYQQVMIEDLFPTLVAVADAKQHLPQGYPLDGMDTRQFWQATDKRVMRPVVFHYPHVWGPHGPGYEPHSAMRLGDWKVIYLYNSRTWLLYDLATDLTEQHNLAERYPVKLAQLASRLKQELESMDVQWPVNRVTDKDEEMKLPQGSENLLAQH